MSILDKSKVAINQTEKETKSSRLSTLCYAEGPSFRPLPILHTNRNNGKKDLVRHIRSSFSSLSNKLRIEYHIADFSMYGSFSKVNFF